MVQRGRRSFLTALLVLALLFASVPGRAAQRRSPATSGGWETAWQRVVVWVAERMSLGLRDVWDKSSSSIDPLGQPQVVAPSANMVQSDYSAGIDPNGQH